MHETMVAQSVFDSVLEQATKYNKKPLSITISCGQFNPINDEAVSFAFEMVAKDTICEGAKLKVIHKPLVATCRDCENKFDFDITAPACTKCQSSQFDFKEDAPLLLEEIELED